ncbi:serine hydrolase domain-containing protein [Sphingobium yanoikuyae]|uniref:serine hydrolase domain-containing protein n=1 Tax=Sphingobium yanoikuyae TaxID=13690 RepID=UPI001F2116DF|nr:serine hydrolase domain-containing protein [Sphingobium yanoikuyae]
MAIAPAAIGRVRGEDALDTFLKVQMKSGGIPGLAVGLARSGQVLLARGYGYADMASRRPVTVDSMFHIASITKTVIATGIMMLAEEGRISLDEPVNRHLDFPVVHPAAPQDAITARHLLTHMSGISDATYYDVDFRTPGKDSPLGLGEFLRSYLVPGGSHYTPSGSYAKAAPGQTYNYCNVGYGLLGYLGGRIAGMDFRTYLQRRLFAPLGMKRLSWTLADVPPRLRVIPYDESEGHLSPVEPVGFPDWSAGMLRASISGFMPFLAASANRGAAGRARMLRAPAMAQMLEMHQPPGLPTWLTGQGLGWMQSDEGGVSRINHWGGDPGVFTAAYIDPASMAGVAIFTNTSATAASRAAIRAIASHLLDHARSTP